MRLWGVVLGWAIATSAAAAAPTPNPADYTLTVHVASEELGADGPSPAMTLHVVVNGENFELIGNAPMANVKVIGALHLGLIPLGDYKAMLTKGKYDPAYLRFDSYDLLMPDGKSLTFRVIGQSE